MQIFKKIRVLVKFLIIKNNNLLFLSFSRDHNLFSYLNGDYRA